MQRRYILREEGHCRALRARRQEGMRSRMEASMGSGKEQRRIRRRAGQIEATVLSASLLESTA
eukprot:5468521-Pleurochrysis_carterae.AAC.4